jgi:hypothetical protein
VDREERRAKTAITAPTDHYVPRRLGRHPLAIEKRGKNSKEGILVIIGGKARLESVTSPLS